MLIKFIPLILIFCNCVSATNQDYSNRPRGVSAEKAVLYAEGAEFQCLDGSKKIPFGQVNDDYCDCEDGSDEPGTSACSNGHFFCHNYGYRALEIPSSRVNDQICDCCDGSDEWDSGVECPNICKELGALARQNHEAYRQMVHMGYIKRMELAKEGAKSMEERQVQLSKMRTELEDLQPIKAEVEARKQEAETKESAAKDEEDRVWNEILAQKTKQESSNYFAHVDVDKDEKVSIEELKAAIKEANDHELEEHEIKSIFNDETELNADQFYEKHTDIHNYFQRKRAVEVPSTTTALPEASDLDTDEDLSDDTLEPEESTSEEEDVPEEEKKPEYTEETKKLIEEAEHCRQQLHDTDSKIQDLESKIREAENFLQFEYGPDYAWAPLKSQCPEINQAQYTYRLCLFDRAVQKDRNGHYEIGLGNWKGWEGPEEDKYSKQKYADGQHCWNGPARSTIVYVECGPEIELFDVKEPAKCEYEFRLRAPAACPDPATLKDPFAVHTEL